MLRKSGMYHHRLSWVGIRTWYAVSLCAALSLAWTLSSSANEPTGPAVEDEVLVQPGQEMSEQALQAIFAVHGAKQVDTISQLNVRILRVPNENRDRVLTALQHNPNIIAAELNYIAAAGALPNDPYIVNGSEWHISKTQADQAWGITTGNANTVIAIVDTGVAPTQPDLAGKLLPGYNFYANNTDTSDDYGHGTAVAGTAAAQGNNGIGVAGVAWNASILPIKISDPTGYATYSNMAKGLTYAVDHGARVINISFYGSSSSSTLQSAADYVWNHNGVVFACAGNAGSSAPQYPAACRNVIAVSSTASNDSLSSFSSYGANISLSAPGSFIWTTNRDGTYGTWSGTSFSSPIAASSAALILAYDPQTTNTRVVQLLEDNSDDLGAAGYDTSFGYGRVNVYRALLAMGGSPSDTTAPVTNISLPTAGITASGTVNIQVNASDNVGVTKVECYVDNALIGVTSQAPASFAWNTLQGADGTHTLRSLAYDSAGNVGTSQDVSVNVQNSAPVANDTTAPAAQITSPTDGSSIGRSVKVYTATSDNVGVTRVELYLDGAFATASTAASPTFNVNSSKWATGAHTLQLIAYDAAGNAGGSPQVRVTK